MLTINMFSSADKVKGQGVGSAYLELVQMLRQEYPESFQVTINKFNKADISHYHTVDPLFYISTFFKKSRGRKIGYVHFVPETLKGSLSLIWPINQIFNKYLISFYKRMDHLVVVNPSFISVLEGYNIPNDKVSYIPNFVSEKIFFEESSENKSFLREKHGFSKNEFIILGAGQIQERKGIDDFVQLAKDCPEITFVWAGGFSFGSMTEGYKKYKEIYENPPENLNFLGIISREELAEYYNMANLFLLPSYNELFPMCILEAFSTGTPVLLRELDLYHSIIQGSYIPAKDRKEMQKWLLQLKNDPDILNSYRIKAMETSQKYSQKHLAEVWYRFYMTEAAKKNKVLEKKSIINGG